MFEPCERDSTDGMASSARLGLIGSANRDLFTLRLEERELHELSVSEKLPDSITEYGSSLPEEVDPGGT